MKVFVASVCALVLLIAVVFTNSLYIERLSQEFVNDIENLDIYDVEKSKEDFDSIYKKFKKAEKIISITTSHDDLTSIEEGFAELMGAIETNDTNEIVKIKSRLKSAFMHLGRLSGINIDSII